MANSRNKCTFCGKFFPPVTMIIVPVGKFCTKEHLIEYGIKSTSKLIKKSKEITRKKHAKEKRVFYDNDLKTRKAAAKLACHRYIKARDKGLPCICCNRPLDGKIDAGHFLESGNNSFLRYHEDNIHSQSVYCNQYKGGDSDDYEGNLRIKIGNKRVGYLLANKGGVLKRTVEDYKAIENYYKKKLKELS